MTIELSENVIEAIADAVVKKMPQPCEDVISREQVLKVMCDKCPMYNCVTGCSSYRHIERMPSVTPQPKVGRWDISTTETLDGQGLFECTVCGHLVFTRIDNHYCPNCGAKMEVDSDDN